MTDLSHFCEGFDLIMKNANVHLKVAESAAKHKMYGIANSHLILCSEEAIKGYIVFSRHYDRELIVEDFDKYFSDHRFKHQMIKDMFHFINFLSEMYNVLLNPILELVKTKKRKETSEEEILAARDKGVEALISWFKSLPSIEHNEQWWNEANKSKNKGFYINLLNNKWQTPFEVTMEEYEKSHMIVTQVMEMMYRIPKVEKDPEFIKIYEKFKYLDKTEKNE